MPTPSRSPAPFWLRLHDRLAGPPNVEKLEKMAGKPFILRYRSSLLLSFAFAVFVFIPDAIMYLNGVPDPGTLTRIQATIVQTRQVDPHLIVLTPDGHRHEMEWPVPINAIGSHYRSSAWRDHERESLNGCNAILAINQVRFVFSNRYRIWNLDCPDKKINIGFDRARRSYESWLRSSKFMAAFIFPICVLLVCISFIREKRGNMQ